MKIAIAATDARMKEVYKEISGFCDAVLLKDTKDFISGHDLDALVLPMKGISEKGILIQQDKRIEIPQKFWNTLPKSCHIFCGLPQKFLDRLQNPIHYYMQEEDVVRKNAVLTAEGCLFLLIDNTSLSILSLCVDIVGYGRCGKEIYSWLKALGVSCRIVRRVDDGMENTISVEHWKQTEPADVIINTSVQRIMDARCIDRWKTKPLIIDIATPDVIDGDYAVRKGIRYIKAGNLPTMIAYRSAGKLIAEYVKEMMRNGK